MIYLLLCILSSAAVLVTFKFAERLKVNTFSAILVNYITACLAGFFLANGDVKPLLNLNIGTVIFMLILGAMFISVFRLIGLSTQRAGVAVTSVAAKMSVILPILFSVWIDANDSLNTIKIVGIVLALVSVLLTTYKKEKLTHGSAGLYLPLIIFIGIGIIDSSVKYAQTTFVTNELNPIFNSAVFAIAGTIGFTILPFNKTAANNLKHIKTWILGVVLGLVNFGSMYFMIAALNHTDALTGKQMQGSILFGINNIGVVVASVFLGLILFKERPTRTNWAGILLSVVSIVILAYS
ncbi:MAG: EamA/RhaT family transporter [Bacteroidales bacterium]|nr:MAG: EamA/RhaT family transporter [Bacteroidales bacterium]